MNKQPLVRRVCPFNTSGPLFQMKRHLSSFGESFVLLLPFQWRLNLLYDAPCQFILLLSSILIISINDCLFLAYADSIMYMKEGVFTFTRYVYIEIQRNLYIKHNDILWSVVYRDKDTTKSQLENYNDINKCWLLIYYQQVHQIDPVHCISTRTLNL